jgi:hypothetical protein
VRNYKIIGEERREGEDVAVWEEGYKSGVQWLLDRMRIALKEAGAL